MATSGRFADLEGEVPYPGVRRRTLHSERMAVAEYTFEPGATFVAILSPRRERMADIVTSIQGGGE